MTKQLLIRSVSKITKRFTLFLAAAVMMASSFYAPALAQTDEEETDSYYYANNGIIFYGVGNGSCDIAGLGPGSNVNTDEVQQKNAKTVIGIAKTYNLGQKGALIGLIVALAESGLKNYANTGVPISLDHPNKEATGRDHDSVGIFQQRVSTGWSTFGNGQSKEIVYQLMDPAYSAQAFFGTPTGAKLPEGLTQPSAIKKGLQNKGDWQTKEPWVVAQDIQISAYDGRPRSANNFSSVYGGNYKDQMQRAQSLLDKFYQSAPAVPLPISITGGDAGNAGTIEQCTGASSQTIVGRAVEYAWPEYHKPNFTELKEPYRIAVDEAQKRIRSGKNDYVGGGRYPGVDCGGFVTRVMRDSGADPDYNKYASNVIAQRRYVDDNPDKYQRITGVNSTNELQPGDIWFNRDNSHTYLYVGKVENFGGNAASASYSGESNTSWRSPMASPAYDLNETWYRLKK